MWENINCGDFINCGRLSSLLWVALNAIWPCISQQYFFVLILEVYHINYLQVDCPNSEISRAVFKDVEQERRHLYGIVLSHSLFGRISWFWLYEKLPTNIHWYLENRAQWQIETRAKLMVGLFLLILVTFHPLCVPSGGYYNHVGNPKCGHISKLA